MAGEPVKRKRLGLMRTSSTSTWPPKGRYGIYTSLRTFEYISGSIDKPAPVAIDWRGGSPSKRPVARQREAKSREQLKMYGLRK